VKIEVCADFEGITIGHFRHSRTVQPNRACRRAVGSAIEVSSAAPFLNLGVSH